MNKILLGATLALGLVLGAASPSLAARGDGLDRNAAATGNGNFGGMHRGARMSSRGVMRSRHHMMRRHHRRHMMRRHGR
ncbi:hypothetical protein FV242_27200 [Methylobacterium sp. WL64]|uniref:hypothetical protein n=1 Tax=Methylobacterium sp. WL64 TaxID=2603894 RepID=UPI0011C81857|nr:hypothetical protein [Methylobacterium sp. WL64]TXM98936.1 hypothetical protein FV242_27200 [Methylobacterium sp. WL64]